MILTLFAFFVAVSLVLIVLGFVKPNESQLALIGFFFLFLCGLTILNGDLQYEVGSNVNTTYQYDSSNRVNSSEQYISYDYNNYDAANSHYFGYWLCAGAAIGFAGVLWGLKKQKHFGD